MSTQRIIKLGQALENKYGESSFSVELIKRAIQALTPIANGSLVFGQSKAQRILNYLNLKLNSLINKSPFRVQKFADASYLDSIIGNMVYSGLPDSTVSYHAKLILQALQDQELESTGSFTEAFIPGTIERYKNAMRNFDGDGVSASNWSAGMPQQQKQYEAAELAKTKERERIRALIQQQKQNQSG